MPFNTQRTSPSPTSRLGGGGLDYITSSTFSAASAVSVDNCFTSTYDHYRIIATFTVSTSMTIRLRMRASASDNTSSIYMYTSLASATTLGIDANSTTDSSFFLGNQQNTTYTVFCGINMYNPALAARTGLDFVTDRYNGTSMTYFAGGGQHDTATAFDGFSLYPSAGNITGTVTVFGYRKA